MFNKRHISKNVSLYSWGWGREKHDYKYYKYWKLPYNKLKWISTLKRLLNILLFFHHSRLHTLVGQIAYQSNKQKN